ncbi:MAG: helix-turn-helix domain-containing protein [Bacteroidota bacterium]
MERGVYFEEWAEPFREGMLLDSAPSWLSGRVTRFDSGVLDGVPTGTATPAHQILLLEHGPHRCADRDVEGRRTCFEEDLVPGDILVAIPEYLLENNRTWTSKSGQFLNVFIEPALMVAACEAAGMNYADVEWVGRFPTPDPLLGHLARAIAAEAEAGEPSGRVYAETLVHAMAAHLLRHHSTQEGCPDRFHGGLPAHRLRRAVAFMHDRLADADLSLDALASAAGLSPFHFARAFRQTTGETPFAFVRRLRMERAARLLAEQPHWSVLAVALAVGYRSPTSFAAAFKGHWGATPSTYRRDRLG